MRVIKKSDISKLFSILVRHPMYFHVITVQTVDFKMASPLAVQRLFSAQFFFADPPSMAYGRSKYDKKIGVGPFILELFAKK